MDYEEGDPPQQAEEEGGEEEREGLSDLQQFNILLSVLVDLSAIGDYDSAISQIELYGDTIDDVCALVERLQWHKEFVAEGGLDSLLQMLSSECDEVVNLSLSGLERILSRWEVAEHAAKAGAFELLVGLIMKDKDSESYARAKASDVLAFLLAPSPNKYLKEESLDHPVFDAHTEMLFSGNENLIDRGLQFLWCITNSYPDAQRKVVEKILQEIVDSDAGKNALRVLHNIAAHESALVTLALPEIEKILISILKIPPTYIETKDKEIAALILANLSPGINVENTGELVLSQLARTLHDYLHDEGRNNNLTDIILGISQITTALLHKDLDKIVENLKVANDLVFLLAERSSVATSDEKALASQVALTLVKRRISLATFQNEDTLEILEILEDSEDERLVRNCYSILRLLREAEQDTTEEPGENKHKKRIEEFHDSPKPHTRAAPGPSLHPRAPSPSSSPLALSQPVEPLHQPPAEEKEKEEENGEQEGAQNGTEENERGGDQRKEGAEEKKDVEKEQHKDKQSPERPHVPHVPHEVHEPQNARESRELRKIDEAKEQEKAIPSLNPLDPYPHDPPESPLAPIPSQTPLPPPPLYPSSTISPQNPDPLLSPQISRQSSQTLAVEQKPIASNGTHQPKLDFSQIEIATSSPPNMEANHDEILPNKEMPTEFIFDTPPPNKEISQPKNGTKHDNQLHAAPKKETDLPKEEPHENHVSNEKEEDKIYKRKTDLASWNRRAVRELVRRVDDIQFLQFLCSSLHLTIADGMRELRH